MSKAVTDPAGRSRTEQSAMSDLVARLGRQFPELTEEEIVRAVEGRYEQFDESAIRDFVPVLVERAVRRDMGGVPRHRA